MILRISLLRFTIQVLYPLIHLYLNVEIDYGFERKEHYVVAVIVGGHSDTI